MKKLILGLICAALLIQPAMAGEKEEVLQLVKQKIDVVISTLKRKDIEKETRDKMIVETVKPFFDFDWMAKLSLGKQGYKAMNKAQRREFTDLFVERLQESFLEKLDIYTDEEVKVEEAKLVNDRIHVVTYLVGKDSKYEMVFRFYKNKKKKEWMVYDVEIVGVSMVQTYRRQFEAMLKKGSVDDLLKRLKVKGEFKVPTGESE